MLGKRHGCPLHCDQTDARPRPARRDPGQSEADNNQRQERAQSARPRQQAAQGIGAEPAMGVGLHLRHDLGRVRLRRIRHRRVRPVYRRLARQTDRGSQYVAIRFTERLAEAGIEPSVGSVGDSYDNALAGTINGLFKAEVIHRREPWRSFDAVEYATLE